MDLGRFLPSFKRKQTLYRLTFTTDTGREVAEDIFHFARLDSTTFDKDPYVSAKLQGRREVALYILETLNKQVNNIGDIPNVSTFNQHFGDAAASAGFTGPAAD